MNIDPIADMLTRIRNSIANNAQIVEIPMSHLKESVAKILMDNNYIKKYEVSQSKEDEHSKLILTLRYYGNKPVINGLKRVSKPGQRIYATKTQLDKMLSSRIEDIVVSTSKGLMLGKQAKEAGLGGEVLFKIW